MTSVFFICASRPSSVLISSLGITSPAVAESVHCPSLPRVELNNDAFKRLEPVLINTCGGVQ